MKSQSFLGGIAVLFFGGLLAKVLGAFYKIPLTWILGAEGLGLYQLVFPLFSLLLIVSSTGLPTAISQLVSKNQQSRQSILRCSLKFMLILSIVACLLLFVFAKTISTLQGNGDIYILYYLIAPAIVFVSVISAFRGFYQGKLNMLPTTLSNVFEQFFKLAFGLFFSATLVSYGVLWGAFGAVLGVVMSEFVAMLFLVVFFVIDKKKSAFTPQNLKSNLQSKQIYKLLFKTATPIVLCSVLIPLSLSLDSVLVVNLLNQSGFSDSQSIRLWGISSGVVNTLLNLPVAICSCIATAIVPHIAMENQTLCSKQNKVYNSFLIMFLIALPFCICYLTLPNHIIEFLYSKSLGGESFVASKMLFLSAPLVLFVCLLQNQTAILQGQKRLTAPTVNLALAVVLKTVMMIFAVRAFSIYGVVFANFVLYGCAVLLNWAAINKMGVKLLCKKMISVFASGACFFLSLFIVRNWLNGASAYLSLPICFLVGAVVFLICMICLNTEKAKLIFTIFKQNVYKRFFSKKL